MKHVLIIIALLSCCSIVQAHPHEKVGVEFVGGYDYYITPNEGNNYNDGQGISLGIAHPIKAAFSGEAAFRHITDIHFPSVDDPKGSFGELRGYGGMYSVKFGLPVRPVLDVYLTAGAGYFVWDFKENPFLQDNQVTVDVDTSFAFEAGGGIDWKVSDNWTISAYAGWFDTNIDKDARDNTGLQWVVLDANEIGLQFIHTGLKGLYEW